MQRAPEDDRVQRIRATIDGIPAGRVATYGRVAELAGLPRRARLVGSTLRDLEDDTELPWHRVIGADGKIHTSGTSASEQARRLIAEGVPVDEAGRVDLRRFRFDGD